MFKRKYFNQIITRLREPRSFIQVLSGPRQTGKTTTIRQVADEIGESVMYVSADSAEAHSPIWIDQQWEIARLRLKGAGNKAVVLVIDEVHKIPRWSEAVKRLWDDDTHEKRDIKVVLLGSAPLLILGGLGESLAGRFELIRFPHWSYREMSEAFGFSLEQYIFFGGYPGSARLISEEPRWQQYVRDSLVETTIAKDVLLMTRVDKPALLRKLFEIGCTYSGQIVSFNKMLGQLHDAGNTTTLSHYLDLLEAAGMLGGIQKYSTHALAGRSSSPKFVVFNNALITSQLQFDFIHAELDRPFWGRLVESALGAYLINKPMETGIEVMYWRERNREVDYVIKKGPFVIAIEVKSGVQKGSLPGIEAFKKKFPKSRSLLVGAGGMGIREFLSLEPEELF